MNVKEKIRFWDHLTATMDQHSHPFIGANPRHNALLAIHFIVIPKGPQDSNTRPAICCPGTCTTPSFRQSLGEIQSGLFKRTAARSASTLTRAPIQTLTGHPQRSNPEATVEQSQSTNQPINQPINQPTNQPTNQSTNQSTNHQPPTTNHQPPTTNHQPPTTCQPVPSQVQWRHQPNQSHSGACQYSRRFYLLNALANESESPDPAKGLTP